MNFRSTKKRRPHTILDMTPLVDVIFQLLLFFLLTSTYTQPQPSAASIPIDLPDSSLKASQQIPSEVIISINAEGKIYWLEQQVSLDELSARLEAQASQDPKTLVLLRGDQKTSYGLIGQIMSIIQQLNLKMSIILQSVE
jgi:biopolymer transport protein ExbD